MASGVGYALAASSSSVGNPEDTFICSICLEVYDTPTTIGCGHTFCAECLNPCIEECKVSKAMPRCPLCRKQFDLATKEKNRELHRRMQTTRTSCKACGCKVRYSKLRIHNSTCIKANDIPIRKFTPVAPTSQVFPVDTPNRSTFHCPFCELSNLDTMGLVKHCNDKHKSVHEPAVCPVCASMPWGNPNQQSGNLVQHLNLRHKFEYETYVDYEADDDTMLRAAINASLQDPM